MSTTDCALCGATSTTQAYKVPPSRAHHNDATVLICDTCLRQIEKKEDLNPEHWQCLRNAMWHEDPAVQVLSWRMLNRFRDQSWAADLLEMMYLDDEHLAWAKATGDHENDASIDIHQDCNGAALANGDTVVLIKSLDVKGSTVNARLGTVVRNIKLDPNDTGYVEGKIEGQSIMIKTQYTRKQGADAAGL